MELHLPDPHFRVGFLLPAVGKHWCEVAVLGVAKASPKPAAALSVLSQDRQ
jgi:hypothetical protein